MFLPFESPTFQRSAWMNWPNGSIIVLYISVTLMTSVCTDDILILNVRLDRKLLGIKTIRKDRECWVQTNLAEFETFEILSLTFSLVIFHCQSRNLHLSLSLHSPLLSLFYLFFSPLPFRVLFSLIWSSIHPAAVGLYFPRKSYQATVYIGQPADTPLLQVYALPDGGEERRANFGFCNNPLSGFRHHWFRIDERSGVFYLNKTLEESDLNLLGKWILVSHGTWWET